jgi:hypothetical protein
MPLGICQNANLTSGRRQWNERRPQHAGKRIHLHAEYVGSKTHNSSYYPTLTKPIVCYTIAFAIMQIPSNAIALKVRPRICIMVCELGWTIFT